jgi:pimeloyl-ACP methyl ester carboxylesterase
LPELETITVDDQNIEFAWFGPPRKTGPVVIMLHEGLGCVSLWRDFPEQIAFRAGLPVLAYSRLGYGGSSPALLPKDTRYMHYEALETLPALLNALEIDDYILFGHSDGASISLILAGGTPAAGLRGIVLEAPHVVMEKICRDSILMAKEAYENDDLRSKLEKYHGTNVDCAFYGWAGPWSHDDFWNWDLREYLPGISVDTLIIQGEDDEYGTKLQIDAIEEGSGGKVQTLLLPNCGHSPHIDQPASVLNYASNFIRALSL